MALRTKPQSTPGVYYTVKTIDPTVLDDNFPIPTIWVNSTTNDSFILTEVSAGAATWSLMAESIVDYDRLAFVSPTFVESTANHRFSTIQSAIDWAYAEYSPISSSDAVVIKVAPGLYNEQIHSYPGMWIVGQVSGMDATAGRSSVTLYNPGTGESSYPLRSNEDESYEIFGINIITDPTGTYGKIPNANFQKCYFKYGSFTERNSSCYAGFSNCRFANNLYGGFRLEGNDLVGNRNLTLRNSCAMSNTPVLTSTHTGWGNFQHSNSRINGNVNIGGDWSFRPSDSNMYGYAHRNVFDTTGEISIISCVIQNGIHFKKNPALFSMIGSTFKLGDSSLIPVGEADIIADVEVTAQTYIENTQQNGLSGKIHTPGVKKYVTPRAPDSYLSLQDAIDSIPASGEGVIELSEDLTGLAEIIIIGEKNITIDGQRAWSLYFTGDIAELGLNQIVALSRVKNIIGGIIEINGDGSEFHLHGCNDDSEFSILLTSGAGALISINNSNYMAPAGLSALQVNSDEPETIIEYSRLMGASGQPAVEFTVVANSKFKTKFSSFIYGAGVGDVPALSSTAASSDIEMYLCGMNKTWVAGHFTNKIGSAGNIADPQLIF